MAINNPLYATELEMMDELSLMTADVKERFRIVDLNSLNWAMRKLIAIDSRKKELNDSIDAEIERLEAFRKQEVGKFQDSEDFFKGLISEFAVRKRDEDPEFKSLKTPYGTIGYRKQLPKWNYDDEKLVKHLESINYDHLLRVKKEANKTEIKKIFKPTEDGRVIDDMGCFVDGIRIEYLPEMLDIKPSGV